MRKGIILAGGTGTRLYPLTTAVCKQLLPIYDKPMIYYPLSTLMLAGVREILIVTTEVDQPAFKRLLGGGENWGIRLSYVVQPRPEGIAQALVLGAPFIAGNPVVLILGDNIFYGHGLTDLLARAASRTAGATIFPYWVRDPERYGVVAFDDAGRPIAIEEKPNQPKSNYAVTGLYFYDQRASELAMKLKPSARGELEISDLNMAYLEAGDMSVELMGRGYAWLDTGTHATLMQAGEFVRTIEERQGLKIGCPEEVAFHMGFIDEAQLRNLAKTMSKSGYGDYLLNIAETSGPVF